MYCIWNKEIIITFTFTAILICIAFSISEIKKLLTLSHSLPFSFHSIYCIWNKEIIITFTFTAILIFIALSVSEIKKWLSVTLGKVLPLCRFTGNWEALLCYVTGRGNGNLPWGNRKCKTGFVYSHELLNWRRPFQYLFLFLVLGHFVTISFWTRMILSRLG